MEFKLQLAVIKLAEPKSKLKLELHTQHSALSTQHPAPLLASFISQRHDRIDFGRTARREPARDKGNCYEQARDKPKC